MEVKSNKINQRFRSFLPVVIDIETGGTNPETDALLEIAAIIIEMDQDGKLLPTKLINDHIIPFRGANIDSKALEVNQIDPDHPFRFAISEKEALSKLFTIISKYVQKNDCQKGVLVGHNAWFDLYFLKVASKRNNLEMPLHEFTSLDTATLSAACFGQTVLAKALTAAKISFDHKEAHSAIYDAKKTAELFCKIINEKIT